MNPYAFIPQGGGDVAHGHRCPGEPVAVALMLASLGFVLSHLPAEPAGTVEGIAEHRMPALPLRRIYTG